MAPTTDDKLDALLTAVGQLTSVVGALAQHVAAQPYTAAGAADDTPVLDLTQDDGYADLTPRDDSNTVRRVELAAELGVLGHPLGEELLRHGARGFYRMCERDEGQDRIELPRDVARRLVEDALLEDPKEAADMGADLLKVWDQEDEERFMERGGVDVEAKL